MPIGFGTGGIRAIMGDGEDQMNEALVVRASRGLAAHLLAEHKEAAATRGVVIAYDTRQQSDTFALAAARAFAEAGLAVYLFSKPTPTPVLSFAVTHLRCVGGVNITASHNAKEYNGYKAYNAYGYQVGPDEAEVISAEMDKAPPQMPSDLQDSRITRLDNSIEKKFLDAVCGQSLLRDAKAAQAIKIVYTPLHGTGEGPVQAVLARDGFTQVQSVAAQQVQDGSFPTVKSPNPEDRAALASAIDQAKAWGADLVLGTDPDCDRVGIAVLHDGEYQLLSGNQTGALLMDYLLTCNPAIPGNGAVIKTIVTNDLGAEQARKAGLTVFETLTGFKYIGELMVEFARTGSHTYVFGYEESYGFLVGTHAHDKDAVVASMLIAEMTAFHLQAGHTLVDVLHTLYTRFGYYLDAQQNIETNNATLIEDIMQALRAQGIGALDPQAVTKDYKPGIDDLPPSDVLKFILKDGSWIAARPSGTEPKLKIYYSALNPSEEGAAKRMAQMRETIDAILKTVIPD